MKLTLLFLVLPLLALAQTKPSQIDINKMKQLQVEMQKKMETELKKMEETNPQQAKMIKNMMSKAGQNTSNSIAADDEGIDTQYPTKPPVKNVQKLNSIPPEVPSKSDIINEVVAINKNLQQQLSPQQTTSYQQGLASLDKDARKMEDAAIMNWVRKSGKGALLYALKAVELNPDEPMYVNNLAALLIQSKKPEKAVPLLMAVLKDYPQSGIALNNLGQAYLALGDLPSAKNYFDKCLNVVSSHPEANHSMGLIYRFQGNTVKSDNYFLEEIKVRFSRGVYDILKAHNPKALHTALLSRLSTPPNYFDQLGLAAIKVPAIPRSVKESQELFAPHLEFEKKMQEEIKKIQKTDEQIVFKKMAEKSMGKNIHSELVDALIEEFQEIKFKQLSWIGVLDNGSVEYPTRGNPLSKEWQNLDHRYRKEFDHLSDLRRIEDSTATANCKCETEQGQQKWKEQQKAIEIKYCEKILTLANNFLPMFADLQQNGFKEHADLFPSLINEAFYYSSLAPDDPTALLEAHNLVVQYLSFLSTYSNETVIANTYTGDEYKYYQGHGPVAVHCDLEALKAEQSELHSIGNYTPNCRIKLTLPLVVAKVSFDCKKVELEGGEGLILGAEYEVQTGKTTLSVGAGIETNVPFVSAGAKQQAYITFDSNGNYSDAGLKGEVGAEIGGYGPTLSSKAGYEIGINAGASASIEGGGNQVF